ncbi:recombinase, partial [Bacteroides sp. ET489]
MRRIAKMPLWAESRIHGDVYVRFGGRLSETYHRKVAWRRQPSL